MTVQSRRWLHATPRMLTGYWQWRNGWRAHTGRGVGVSLVGVGAWTATVLLLAWAGGTAGAAVRGWLHDRELFLAGVAAVLCGIGIAHRRAVLKDRSLRSWVAALPARPMVKSLESGLIDVAPAGVLIGMLATAQATAWAAARLTGRPWSADIGTVVLWVLAGLGLGAVLGKVAPTPKPIDLPPGSRYVPRPAARATALTPSLAALGVWPVRQMFASARPKAVAHALMLVLVCMPLGTMADAAMVVVGMFVATGALLLLVAALLTVGGLAARWLQPLPVPFTALAAALMGRSLAFLWLAVLVDAALLWVLGASELRAFGTAVVGILAVSIIALLCGLGAIAGARRGLR